MFSVYHSNHLDVLKSLLAALIRRDPLADPFASELILVQSPGMAQWLKQQLAVEFGIESTCDETLRAVNRGHDFACARRAVEMAAERGLHVGAHFILGLPGETDEMLLEQVATINSLPLTTVKFHQLQVFRGTPMAAQYDADPRRFRFWEVGQYIDLFVEILRRLRPDLVVERFASEAPPRYHYGRNWGLIRNETLLAMLEKRLEERNAYQGEFFTIFAENNVE